MTDTERYEMIKHCRYVDELITDAPWTITQEFLDKHKVHNFLFFLIMIIFILFCCIIFILLNTNFSCLHFDIVMLNTLIFCDCQKSLEVNFTFLDWFCCPWWFAVQFGWARRYLQVCEGCWQVCCHPKDTWSFHFRYNYKDCPRLWHVCQKES